MSRNNTLQNKNIIYGLVVIILGIFLCIMKTKFVETAIIVAGIVLLLFGFLEIIKGIIPFGIIKIIIGILLIVLGATIINIAFFAGGIAMIFMGIYKFNFAIGLQKHTDKLSRKILCFVSPVLTIACGCLFISLRYSLTNTLCIILGIILIITGISLIFEKEE